MYNNSDGRFILHFLTSTAFNLPSFSLLFTSAPAAAIQSFTNKHSFNRIYISVLLYTDISMLFNALTVLGFAAVALAGKQCKSTPPRCF
jgi:hypothetical protein